MANPGSQLSPLVVDRRGTRSVKCQGNGAPQRKQDMTQLDKIEAKIDSLTEMMLTLLQALAQEDDYEESGERDQTQPL